MIAQTRVLRITIAKIVKLKPRLKLSFSVPEETQELIDSARQALSGKLPKGASLEELFVSGLESIIAQDKKKAKSLGTRKSRKPKKRTRHIPAKIRKTGIRAR